MRIWIAGGGTGGHVYPGLAVVRALGAEPVASGALGVPDRGESCGPGPSETGPAGRFQTLGIARGRSDETRESDVLEVLYVGGAGGVEERLVERAGVQFVGVPAGGVHGLAPWRVVWNFVKLLRGAWAAYRLGRRARPAALFATGGYASVPVALAAWALRAPILVYLPDIEPGQAVRVIARMAARVAVTAEDSRSYFAAGKTIVTGYPVRDEFYGLDRTEARGSLELDFDRPVLLVMGGSRGARSINQALSGVLEQVLEMAQVVHVSGELDWPWVSERRDALPAALKARYRAFPYLHERMGAALAAADLAVCRAGASTLGELPFFGLPAVLVPYPHAWRYQRVNADWLAGRGAAVRLDDGRMPDELLPMLRQLLDDRERLSGMRIRMHALARPDAAANLAAELRALARR